MMNETLRICGDEHLTQFLTICGELAAYDSEMPEE